MPAFHPESIGVGMGESRRGLRSTENKEFYLDALAFPFAPFFLLVCFSLHLHFPYLSISLTCRFLLLAVSCPCLCYKGGCFYSTTATNCHVPDCRLASYCVTKFSG